MERARLLPHHVEIALAAGDLEVARQGVDELQAIADDYQTPRLKASYLSAQGALQLARSDPSTALTTLRRAIGLWTDIDSPYQIALERVRVAEAYRLLADDDAAIMELDAARGVFESLGASRDARRAAELLGETTYPGGLSDREVEVLRLVAAGKANKQIAAELLISERTVARHLSNIFVKLDVSSRAGAAALALKKGLA